MKRSLSIVALLLAVVCVFSLAACNSDNVPSGTYKLTTLTGKAFGSFDADSTDASTQQILELIKSSFVLEVDKNNTAVLKFDIFGQTGSFDIVFDTAKKTATFTSSSTSSSEVSTTFPSEPLSYSVNGKAIVFSDGNGSMGFERQ